MLNGITGKQSKVIISNGVTTLLKKGKQGVITQLYSLDVQTCKPHISPNIQRILKNPSKVFEDIPISHPPIQYLDNAINLNLGSVPSIIRPYKYPYVQKNEMDQMVKSVIRKSIVQAVADHIEHQQAVLQIPTMPENKMKLQTYQYHPQRSFEEAQIIWEPDQIIDTRTK